MTVQLLLDLARDRLSRAQAQRGVDGPSAIDQSGRQGDDGSDQQSHQGEAAPSGLVESRKEGIFAFYRGI